MAFKWSRRTNSKPSQVHVTTSKANAAVTTAAETPLPADKPGETPTKASSKDFGSTSTPKSPEPTPGRPREQSVISNDDEQYLENIVSAAEEPRLPPYDDASDDEQPSLAEAAAAEVAKKTPLPASPPTSPARKKSSRYSWTGITDPISGGFSFKRNPFNALAPAPAKPLDDKPVQGPPTEEEEQKEKKEMANILEKLKLDPSSMQTRALALSDDSRKMLNQFIQILKDVVSGAPHAYEDLDDFIKHREKQIEGLYDSLPPFLQKLVEALPTKAWQYLGPQVAAGMAAATSGDKTRAQAEQQKQQRSKSYVPSLKSLLSNQGAVTAMLRSILEFLEARFPAALAGTNVLLSLAVFLLLFVFWYCHKRGREERLVITDEESKRGRSRESVDDDGEEKTLGEVGEGTKQVEQGEKAPGDVSDSVQLAKENNALGKEYETFEETETPGQQGPMRQLEPEAEKEDSKL